MYVAAAMNATLLNDAPWLVADIGGTRLRAALCGPGAALHALATLACADYATPGAALADYLARCGARPHAACLAVAGAVTGDVFRFTNRAWEFSQTQLRAELGLAQLLVRNDFEALALALPELVPADLQPIGAGSPRAGCPLLVLGPGTGLGVATLVPHGGGWLALAGEGGHAGFAPQDDLEIAVAAVLRRATPRVSNETILSGSGLAALYAALALLEGRPAQALDAAQVSARALDGSDALAVRALDVFCAVLGAVAGDMALVTGARGGVYIGGGIAPRLLPFLRGSRFRARFEAKAAQQAYVAAIPTQVIVHAAPALLGARAALRAA